MIIRRFMLIAIILFSFGRIIGCSCGSTNVDIHHINSSDFWIKGVIVERTVLNEHPAGGLCKYKIEVLEVYKGDIESNHVSIIAPIQESNCGVYYEISDEPLFLFLSWNGIDYQTDLCSMNIYENTVDQYYKTLLNNYLLEEQEIWKDRDEKTIGIGKLRDGKPIGKWEEYYGAQFGTKSKGKYRKGERQGIWKLYSTATGELIRKTNYRSRSKQINANSIDS